PAGYPGFDSSLRYSRRNSGQQSRVNGFGNDILPAESNAFLVIGYVDNVGDWLFGQVGKGIDRCQLHGFVDFSGTYIESAAEYIREAEHIVDLVGKIRPSGSHDDVVPGFHSLLVGD